MFDGIPITEVTGPAALCIIAFLVITRRLIWHTDLRREEKRRVTEVDKEASRADKWEDIALRSLGVAEKMTVHAEVANEVISAIPVPGAKPSTEGSS